MTIDNAARLTTQSVATRAALDAVFELFGDEQTVVVELDAGGRIVRCNAGCAAACRRDPASLAGVYPPDAFALHVEPPATASETYLHAVAEQWQAGHDEYRRIRWLKLWAFGKGDAARVVKLGIREPVHDLEGDADHNQLQAFLDAAPDAIITIDDGGNMVSVNPATETLFGYRPSELLGRNVSVLMPSPDRERHDEYLARYLETGEARIIGTGRDITARRQDGTTFPARLSVSEFTAQERRFFTGILHDISERIEAQEQQRVMFAEHAHASRVVALGEMASSIAHEINQPLTAIVSYADASRKLIEMDQYDAGTLNHALKQIAAQGQRAGEIIRRLREFVKKKTPSRSSSDINELIHTAVAFTSHDVERYGITLELDFDDHPLLARVDRLQIEQVVLNLLRNSLDAVNEHETQDGRVKIASRSDGELVSVSISDNGRGIKPSEYASVFDAFYTTKESGTGLGLSISHSIVEAHGGSLSFQPNEGSGVTFTMTLPLETDD